MIMIDQADLIKGQQPLHSSYLNISEFESQFIRQTGSNHLRPSVELESNANPILEGPSLVLAASSNRSIEELVQMDPAELTRLATAVKQRFLGEVFLSSFADQATKNKTEHFQASQIQQQTRLTPNLGIGITIASCFMLLATSAVTLVLLVSLRKRPLQLIGDPNHSSTAALLLADARASALFKTLDRAHPSNMRNILQDQSFSVRDGKLVHTGNRSIVAAIPPTPSQAKRRRCRFVGRNRRSKSHDLDWCPFPLHRITGSMLVPASPRVIVALLTIYSKSRKRPLYQSAFTYKSGIRFGNLNIMTLAPYGIVPTLLAVLIKLWWSAIDSVYRRLAPLLTMAKDPSPKASKGSSLTYLTSPILWITLLALRRRHLLLALVTLGTLASEALQISMSALWTRKPGLLDVDTLLTKDFELRSVAHVFNDSTYVGHYSPPMAFPMIAEHLYGGSHYQTSWVYGSLAELAFQASPPIWSKDGWNFPPVDTSGLSKVVPSLPKINFAKEPNPDPATTLNVTFESTGLRGRVECVPIDDGPRWVVKIDNFDADFERNGLKYKSSRNYYRPNISSGFELSSAVRILDFTKPDESQPSTVAIGQWLHFNYSSDDHDHQIYSPSAPQNFTVLWINASYPYVYETSKTEVSQRFIFADRPQVQALNCRPIFETSKARIIVNAGNGHIEDFRLLEPAKPFEDAWSERFQRHYSSQSMYLKPAVIGMRYHNSTVSWGYLFQLALLQACNFYGGQSAGYSPFARFKGTTPFSFIEQDLYSDPYSYASLALVEYNRTALLNATTLTAVTQRVFSTFFQWFASSESGYTGDYWAYQPLGARLPDDLDNGTLEIMTATSTQTSVITMRISVASEYERTYTESKGGETRTRTVTNTRMTYTPTLTSHKTRKITITTDTIRNTRSTASLSILSSQSGTATKSSATNADSTTITSAPVAKQGSSTDATDDPRKIRAKVTIRTETLVISPLALFLSVGILIFLPLSAIFIFVVRNSQLPSPASRLRFTSESPSGCVY
ncbi:hypothetical protein CC80DRAFT_585878 [Byssothecium circinans]|uniref:Uncharacterized protein n=1 Tax=Byssothecium circinans TaxID=147558 RepID=A0A6A5U396_9PLEO|nr:hypothetical protein CC80DRAFT_585878 [Byssothecium circinans]